MTGKYPRKTADSVNSHLSVVPLETPILCQFETLISDWLISRRAARRSEKTRKGYQDALEKFLWWYKDAGYYRRLGAHPRNVTRSAIEEFMVYLQEPNAVRWGKPSTANNGFRDTLSDATIDHYARTVRAFFNWLVNQDHIDKSPFDKVEVVAMKRNQTIKVIPRREMDKLFRYLLDPEKLKLYTGRRDIAIFSFVFDTGVRKGELLSMRMCDLSLETCRAMVVGKTGKREVPFGEDCRATLVAYLSRLEPDHKRPEQKLWQTIDGFPMTGNGLGSIVARLKKATGVDFSLHDLRHTAATEIASRNNNLFYLKSLLGHRDISTTQKYVNLNPEQMSEFHREVSPLAGLMERSQQEVKRRGRPRK